MKDITNIRYGSLTAKTFSHNIIKKNGNKGEAYWVWQCDCGGQVVAGGAGVCNRFKKRGHVTCKACASKTGAAKRAHDYTGQRFGMLTGLEQVDLHKSPAQARWLWQCDCGKKIDRLPSNVKGQDNPNCGCSRSSYNIADRTGERFGMLVAIERLELDQAGRTYLWKFQCDCGNTCTARLRDAVSGQQQSCGCRSRGNDNIAVWLDGSFRNAEQDHFFYVYNLKNFDGYCKPGIAKDLDTRKRGSRGQYGELYDFLALPRIEAWLVEQAVDNATIGQAKCPTKLIDRKWEGYSEVRQMPAEHAFDLALQFHDQLQELGREEFAIRFLPMSPSERRRLEAIALPDPHRASTCLIAA